MKPSDLSVRHRYANFNGVQLHWVEAGPDKPNAPLVVLLHGFPEMWWSWRHQLPALANSGYRVIAPDLRGYNDSEKEGPYNLHTATDDVCALIESTGAPSADVIGHDWGGAIAWNLAATRPEVCRKIAVINCPHPRRYLKALRSDLNHILRSLYVLLFQFPVLPELLFARARGLALRTLYQVSSVDPTHFGDEEIAPLIEAIKKPGVAHAAAEYCRTLFREAIRDSQSVSSPKISCPTLLIWGKKDLLFSFDSLVPGTEEFVDPLRIETIENCGHFSHQEQPDRVNELLLDFLREDKST